MRKVLTGARRHRRLRSATALVTVGAMTMSLGVILIGATTAQVNADEPCVPQDAWTETIQHPAVTHSETVTVVDQAAYDEVVPAVAALWANFAPKDQQATFIGPPTWPEDLRGEWSIHYNDEGPSQDESGVFSIGDPDKGGNWFYRQPETAEQIIHRPAVTHTETVVVTDQASWTETIEHPAVTCEPETGTTDVCPNIEGDQAEVPEGYELEDGDCVQIAGEETVVPKPKPVKKPVKTGDEPTVKGVQAVAPPAAAPTAVAAGLAGQAEGTTGQLLGQGLVGLGLVMLVTAGWLGVPRRALGAHES